MPMVGITPAGRPFRGTWHQAAGGQARPDLRVSASRACRAMMRPSCRLHRLYAFPKGRAGPATLDRRLDLRGRPGDQDRDGARRRARPHRAAVRQRRDPARALGPDGRPAVSRRAPIWEDVPDEKWNDWRWQLSHRVNDLDEIEQVLNLTDDERAGLSAPDKFRVDITPYFISLIDPERPERPDPPPGHPDRSRAAGLHRDDGGLARRGPPLPGAGARPPLSGPRPDARHHPVRSYCRYCTRSRIVGDPTQNFNRARPRGAARVPAPDAAGPRRPDLAAGTA